jgi:hypothetical protein
MLAIVPKVLGQWRSIACQSPKLDIIAIAGCLTGASPVFRLAT